ncbi:hypothetical protein [Granulicella mallensis]|jgi:hypothetical protein|uniref:Uncharacterized protein n=2 Tax=Granulicella mallensis TaxID=940614 RepID=G8NYZ1_GRAMM|nr:hypothetical protein [Granulicella mallensis]AEU35643.1 hypothetical protein AciX8_1300 [Granulicella mallensis MP5ACTX8]MBB5066848.1 putative membrane protein YiaA [Granulicella mallensis]
MIDLLYITLATVYVAVVVGMVTYNINLHSKRDTLAEKGRLPMSLEEGILVSLEHKRHHIFASSH